MTWPPPTCLGSGGRMLKRVSRLCFYRKDAYQEPEGTSLQWKLLNHSIDLAILMLFIENGIEADAIWVANLLHPYGWKQP